MAGINVAVERVKESPFFPELFACNPWTKLPCITQSFLCFPCHTEFNVTQAPETKHSIDFGQYIERAKT